MAQLPVYDPQTPLGDGGNSFRMLHREEYIGEGVSHFGSQLGNAAVQTAKADATISAAEDAEQKRVAGLGDAIVRQQMETEWHQKQVDLEQNIPANGADYAKTVAQAFDDHLADYQDKWSGRRYGENQVLNMRERDKVISHAIDYETRTRLQNDSMVAKNNILNQAAAVGENPKLFDTALQELELRGREQGFSGKLMDAYMRDGRAAIESSTLTAAVRDNPLAVISAGRGAFADMANGGANSEVEKIARGAAASGTDLKTMVAIGKIESGLDPNARPIDPNTGRALSSAAGVFQFLQKNSAYGVVDPNDTEGQAKALGLFLDQWKGKLDAIGIDATPGRLYMAHNLGEPLSKNVLTADPNEKMGDIIKRTYPSRPELAAQIAVNNPGLYNVNMTAGQVAANYERKMAGAMGETKDLVTSDKTMTTDEVAKDRLSKLLGVDIQSLGSADFSKAVGDAQQAYAKDNKEAFKLAQGQALHDGLIRVSDPYDHTALKPLHDYARTTGIADNMLAANNDVLNKQGFKDALASVHNASVVAQPYVHAARELIMNGTDSSPNKARAYEFMANIAQNEPIAWNASQIDEGTKARVEKYRALTQGDYAIVTPAEAIKSITAEHSPDGKTIVHAQRELFKANKNAELKALTVGDVDGVISKGLWRNANFSGADGIADDQRKQAIFDKYREAYELYRGSDGNDIATAKARALQSVADKWQVTNLFRGPMDRSEITQYPPEKVYPPIDAEHPYQWIEEQGRNVVNQAAAAAGVDRNIDKRNPGRLLRDLEIRMVPTEQTKEDFAARRAPAYNLMYRDPKTNLLQLAAKDWRPDIKDAQDKFYSVAAKRNEIANSAKEYWENISPIP